MRRIRSALPAPRGSRMHVAVDGSYRNRAIVGAWLAEDGRWEIQIRGSATSAGYATASSAAELYAAAAAITAHPSNSLVLLTDFQGTVNTITRWRTGDVTIPFPTYPGTHLHTVAAEVAARRSPLRVEWIRSHNLHYLNEGADTLARLGSRRQRDRLNAEQTRARAEPIAAAFAQAWRDQQQARISDELKHAVKP